MEEAKQHPASQSKPTIKDPQTPVSKFCDVFTNSQNAFENKFLKTGPLSANKAKDWGEDLASFIKYKGIIRNKPDHKFSTPKLWPNTSKMYSRGPTPVITLNECEKGSPPLPKPQPVTSRQPLLQKVPKPPLPTKTTATATTARRIDNPAPAHACNKPKKPDAVTTRKTQSQPPLAYSAKQSRADTKTVNERAKWASTKDSYQSRHNRKTSMSYTSMSLPSDEDT